MPRFPSAEIPHDAVMEALKAVNGNQNQAAKKLGVSQYWVSKWLKANGYVMKVLWVKPTEGQQGAN